MVDNHGYVGNWPMQHSPSITFANSSIIFPLAMKDSLSGSSLTSPTEVNSSSIENAQISSLPFTFLLFVNGKSGNG